MGFHSPGRRRERGRLRALRNDWFTPSNEHASGLTSDHEALLLSGHLVGGEEIINAGALSRRCPHRRGGLSGRCRPRGRPPVGTSALQDNRLGDLPSSCFTNQRFSSDRSRRRRESFVGEKRPVMPLNRTTIRLHLKTTFRLQDLESHYRRIIDTPVSPEL